jgi:hypothetical protein
MRPDSELPLEVFHILFRLLFAQVHECDPLKQMHRLQGPRTLINSQRHIRLLNHDDLRYFARRFPTLATDERDLIIDAIYSLSRTYTTAFIAFAMLRHKAEAFGVEDQKRMAMDRMGVQLSLVASRMSSPHSTVDCRLLWGYREGFQKQRRRKSKPTARGK